MAKSQLKHLSTTFVTLKTYNISCPCWPNAELPLYVTGGEILEDATTTELLRYVSVKVLH